MSIYRCIVPVCPIRSEPGHRSEQVSQLLFGEYCNLLEVKNDFVKIKIVLDEYEGWCQVSQLQLVIEDIEVAGNELLAGGWINSVEFQGNNMHIPFGSKIDWLIESGCNKPAISAYTGSILKPARQIDRVTEFALMYLHTPYLWGGRSVFGIDCSGLTQMVYRCLGVALLRDAWQQASQGDVVGFLQEARSGDLAFFDNEEGRIVHVGILTDSHSIIHAMGKVRIDNIDNHGIVNTDTGKRTHALRLIKRILV